VSEQGADAQLNEQVAPPDVPDFDLVRPIGSGGFGEVWLATNRTTGQLRAVKVIPLHAPGSADPAGREISSLTRLEANSRCRHPNLLQIHHIGKTATHLFYVMDPADDVSGEPASGKPDYRPATLQSKLQDGPLSPDVCLDYARQLLAGLAMLHAAGMVHRDVKPANCLFVGGQLKLADFGLLTEAHPLVSRVGTQKYMPPDGRMDMRADVYAAGLVIYEMISGLPVDEFPRLGGQSKRVGDSPILTALLRLVLHACERESDKRPPDARAMLAELAVPIRAASRRQRPLVAIGVGVVLAVAGVGVWMFQEKMWPSSGQTVETPGAAASNRAAVPTAARVVDVSFVTEPFEAKIYLDGELLCKSDAKPYRTPCTINGLPARTCRVAFQCNKEPHWGTGSYDLGRTQQIVIKRP
jgi:eukaryotic-like serine/threonine-protein kinase